MKSARLLAEAMGISKKDVEGKSFDEVTEIIKTAKGKPDATADEWKTKATTLEAELAKINSEVIPGIHNEYKAKEMQETRDKKLFGLFDTVPVLDELKPDFTDIVRKRIASTGIEVKLGDNGTLEYYDKDGTRAKNKATGKDLTDADFVDVIKPTLKGYVKESNGGSGKPEPVPAGGERNDKVNSARQRKLDQQRKQRDGIIE